MGEPFKFARNLFMTLKATSAVSFKRFLISHTQLPHSVPAQAWSSIFLDTNRAVFVFRCSRTRVQMFSG